MEPLREFYIPSVHDGTRLSCRIYQPDGFNALSHSVIKAAVLAHPYAYLGGSNEDPVVLSVAGELVRNGFIVLAMNFRGASYSGGSTTWTAKAEMGDYISAYGLLLKYAQLMAGASSSTPVELLLAGYSYGSLIASYQPSVADVQAIFAKPQTDSHVAKILAKANQIAAGEQVNELEEFYDSGRVVTIDEKEGDLPSADISFLLVSPILATASSLVTLWADLSKVSIGNRTFVTLRPDERLPKNRTCIIYGTDDMFTSDKKLRAWTQKLKDAPESRVKVAEIRGAGHFYTDEIFHRQLRGAIAQWLGRDW